MRMLLWLTLLLACSGPPADTEVADTDPADTDAVADTDTDSDSDSDSDPGADTSDTAVATLYGTVPAEALPAPEFTATNRDGSARTRAHLTDRPTVMWFYPAANTYG